MLRNKLKEKTQQNRRGGAWLRTLTTLTALAMLSVKQQTRTFEAIKNHNLGERVPLFDSDVNLIISPPTRHIVVAHCKEDLSWLNQLRDYNPSVCQHCHIHIYSKCGFPLDLEQIIPAVSNCATLHRLMNHGVEEYAYLTYIEDMYDNLPAMVSFIQAGALTENPHVIHDIFGPDLWLPGLTFRSLTRAVSFSWHMIDYEKVEKRGEAEIMTKNNSSGLSYLFNMSQWVASWRSMFTVSSVQIKKTPWNTFSFIKDKLRNQECTFLNCNMELLYSSLFGCNTKTFEDLSLCTSGVFANMSLTIFEEDYRKDTLRNSPNTTGNEYVWKHCGSKSLLYSVSKLNGDLICLENANATPIDAIQHNLHELIVSDTWRANLSNQQFQQDSAWFRSTEILNSQK